MSSVQKNSVYIITGWIAIGLLGCAVLLSVYNKMKSESAGNTIGVQSLTALAVISVGIGLLSVKDATPPSSPVPGTEGGQCRSVKEGSPCNDGLVCRAAGGDMGGVPLCMKPPAPKPDPSPAPGTKGGPCRSQAGGNNNLPCNDGLQCVNVSDNVSVCMPKPPAPKPPVPKPDPSPTPKPDPSPARGTEGGQCRSVKEGSPCDDGLVCRAAGGDMGGVPLCMKPPVPKLDPMNLQLHENYENFKPTFHGRTEW